MAQSSRGRGQVYGEGSVAPGPVLSPEWKRQEAGIRGAEAAVVEQVGGLREWIEYAMTYFSSLY